MYCVKCGVKLQDQVSECPLCGTPVWNPDKDASGKKEISNYPDKMPLRNKRNKQAILALLTALSVFVIVVETVICLLIYKNLNWSGYVTGGVVLLYVYFLLPFWFERPKPEVFILADHVITAFFVYYVCRKTGGHWFLSFALPILAGSCLLILAAVYLFKHVRRRRALSLGGLCIALGGYIILIEFFASITFDVKMFTWSWFPFAGLAAVGIFFLLCGTIRPLRSALEKYFFF